MSKFIMIGILLVGLMGIYWYFYIKRILTFLHIDMLRKRAKVLNCFLAAAAAFACVNMWSTVALFMLHIFVFSASLDVIFLILKKVWKNQENRIWKSAAVLYKSGLLPVVITAILLAYGFWNMARVTETTYQAETEKSIGSYKIALITDTHYGTIQNTKLLDKKVKELNGKDLDLVILGGDIVEEDTSKEEMRQVFQLFGGLDTAYGVYYVYGNHDKQPYAANRSYTSDELTEAIQENGIAILEDSYVEINGELVLAGRRDAGWGNTSGRASAEELLRNVNREKYIIVADHQPIRAEENDAQGVDLQVSGHTHAGQIWPIGRLSELAGVFNYGEYQKGNCKVIVSSGFTGWGYPFRTEEHCEYVIINLNARVSS